MRILLIFFLFFSFNSLLGQSDSNDSVKFLLKGYVRNSELKAFIIDAQVRIVGSDGSDETVLTNTLGYFEYILPLNTSFSITVSHPDFLNSRGKEHAISYTESKVFIHNYELNPIVTYGCFIIGLDIDSTFSLKPISLKDDTIVIFKRNEKVEKKVIHETLHRVNEKKYQLINKSKRIQNLRIELVDTSKLKISIKGLQEKYWINHRITNTKEWYELIRVKTKSKDH